MNIVFKTSIPFLQKYVNLESGNPVVMAICASVGEDFWEKAIEVVKSYQTEMHHFLVV